MTESLTVGERAATSDESLLDSVLVRRPRVIERAAGEWLMLIDVETGSTYEANRVGAEIWRASADGRSLRQTRDLLCAAHGAPVARVESDVLAFARELVRLGLATVAAVA